MIEKLQETFTDLDPEVNTMIAFQEKINEIIETVNALSTAIEIIKKKMS